MEYIPVVLFLLGMVSLTFYVLNKNKKKKYVIPEKDEFVNDNWWYWEWSDLQRKPPKKKMGNKRKIRNLIRLKKRGRK